MSSRYIAIVIHALLALMFLSFALVQLNDPDPVIWVVIYGAMVVVCVMAAFHYYNKLFLRILLIVFAVYSTLFLKGFWYWLTHDDKGALFDDLAKMQYPYIEETREFLGLLICILALIAYLFSARKRSKGHV
jgi:hypothetical protein